VPGIKALGSVTAVSPGRIDVAVDAEYHTPDAPSAVTLDIDDTTSWRSAAGVSTTPSELVAGQSIGFAGTESPDGTYHALVIDSTAGQPGDDADAGAPKGSGPEQPTATTTRKSPATVVAADASSITVTIHEGPDADQQLTLSLAGATFSVGDVTCQPTAPLVAGTEIGIAYDAANATALMISLG
jgi:hypothetical protein